MTTQGNYNPYQPPVAPAMPHGYGPPMMAPMHGGLWRKGNILVMHKMAQLPDLCVKSGEPTTRRLKRNLYWHHPAITLSILAGVLLYVILAAVLSHRATVFIGLSDKWFAKRRIALAIGWALGLGSVAVFFGSFGLAETVDWWPLLMLLALLMFLGGLIYGQVGSRMVHPQKMDDQYIWLKGVHQSVLARFPEWPYPA